MITFILVLWVAAFSQTTGLDFPSNVTGADQSAPFVAMQFEDPQLHGLPLWGPGGAGATYIWKVRLKASAGKKVFHKTLLIQN